MDFLGKSILVLGGSSGIGRATAIYLNSLGARVLATGRDKTHIEETLKINPRIEFFNATFPEDIPQLVDWVFMKLNEINGIVFSQGVIYTEPFSTFREHELDSMWEVNVKTNFLVLQKLLPLFKNGGSVVFISSIDAFFLEDSPSSGYALTKSAIIGLTNSLAGELGQYNIRVNCVVPGLIRTNMTEDFFKSEFEKERLNFLKRVPLKREGSPEEVAKLIVFLLSDDSSYITGDAIFIDGGYHIG